ncbi:hypothetical protein D3C73_1216320 [compost metagenome]
MGSAIKYGKIIEYDNHLNHKFRFAGKRTYVAMDIMDIRSALFGASYPIYSIKNIISTQKITNFPVTVQLTQKLDSEIIPLKQMM